MSSALLGWIALAGAVLAVPGCATESGSPPRGGAGDGSEDYAESTGGTGAAGSGAATGWGASSPYGASPTYMPAAGTGGAPPTGAGSGGMIPTAATAGLPPGGGTAAVGAVAGTAAAPAGGTGAGAALGGAGAGATTGATGNTPGAGATGGTSPSGGTGAAVTTSDGGTLPETGGTGDTTAADGGTGNTTTSEETGGGGGEEAPCGFGEELIGATNRVACADLALTGWVYVYGDDEGTCEVPDNPCADGQCCMEGATTDGADAWGCGLGVGLNDEDNYTGPAECFQVGLSGDSGDAAVRFQVTQSGGDSPLFDLGTVSGSKNECVCLSDVECPDWSDTCDTGEAFDLQFQVVGGEGAEPSDFNVCLTSLVPVESCGGSTPGTGGSGGAGGGEDPETGGTTAEPCAYGQELLGTTNRVVCEDLEVSGWVYAYGDDEDTCEIPDNPCEDGQCCIDGSTSTDADAWGCGLGIGLNDEDDYTGPVECFEIGLSGDAAAVRFQLAQSSGDSPLAELGSVSGSTTECVCFSDVECPDWSSSCDTGEAYDLQFQVVGGEGADAGAFDLCITSIVPVESC